MRRLACPALIVALALGVACTPAGPAIRVEDAWSRPTTSTPAGTEDERASGIPGVVYMSIVNAGGAADRLIDARSDRCETVEIHETRIEDGRMRMIPVEDGMPIARRTTVEFSPGGHHLMLIGLHEPLRVGDRVDLTLRFETTGELPVVVEVRKP